MEEYKVKISPAAQNDFYDIIEHLETLPPEAAIQYFDMFIEKTGLLAKTPESSPLARDTQLRLRGYRMLSIEDYIIFYVVCGKSVGIRRILHTRRQYERLF